MRFFGHDVPRLSWLNAKTKPNSQGGGRKNRSGYAPEHQAAILTDRLRTSSLRDNPPVEANLTPIPEGGVIHPLQEI